MDLMKDLLTHSPAFVESSSEFTFDFAKNKRYKTIMMIVERELDHLASIGKLDSNFAKLVRELGGDPGILKEIGQQLDLIREAFDDLEMSVAMAKEMDN